MTVPIEGGAISVNRSYSSARLVDGILGVGNSSMLQARLYYATYLFAAPSTYRSVADVVMPDGWQYRFIETTPGQFTPPATRRDVLVRNADGSFDLTLEKSRTVYHYLADGNAASIRDHAGNLTLFSYDGSGRLSRVADGSGSGRYVDVFWGADGRIASLRDSASRIVSYTYNLSGSLASMTDPAGRQTTFSYVTGRFSTPLLSRVTDPWGRIVTDIAYLPTDQVFSYTENGETWRMSYNYQDDPRLTAKLDSCDNTWRLRFGSDIQITDRIAPDDSATNTVYSPEGWVQQQTDQTGILTSYTYDTAGKVTSVTRDAQTSSSVRYDYVYDAAFPEKVASVIPHDPATNLSDPDWQAWRYDYHPSGSASPGALFHVYRVQSDGTTLETVATYEYDTVGRVTRQTSATGAQTDYSYDSSGNLQSVTGPANNDMGTRPQTTYAYDSLGRVTLVTDPLGNESTYTYDPLGRVLTVTLPKPSAGSTLAFTTTYVYDEFDASTGLVFTRVTDPNGKVTRLGYDQFGRLARSVDAASGITSYSYTADVLSSITDANGNVTSYLYDAQRRLTRTTFPDGAYESYAYTVDGLLLSKTDRRAVTVTYDYDALKRLVTKSYSTGGTVTYSYQGQFLLQVQDTVASPPETHGFTYDPSYRLSTTTQASRGSLTYTYRADDRVESMAIAAGPTTTHTYYPDGSLRTTDWSPVTGSFRWDYTLPGQYQTLTLPITQARSYTYDDQGRLLQLGNSYGGTTLAAFSYGYDHDYALGTDTILGQRTSAATTLPAQALTGALATYRYDSLYQLTRTDYPIAPPFNAEIHQWTYDAIGNRLTNTIGGNTLAYSYLHNGANPLNGQRVQNDGVNAYGYDAAGNTTSRQGPGGNFAFDFDPENRLSAITGPVNAAYTYDYQGRRTTRTVGGVTTTYLYDGLNLVSETTGGQTTHFLNGPGIDEPLAMAKSGAVSYFSVDGLGSVVATNDPTGTVTHSVLFDAWGNVKGETGTREHPFTYTGREVGEAGFHFYRARFYQPSIGRFTQEDPVQDRWREFIVQQDSAHAWNPHGFSDLMGLCTLGRSSSLLPRGTSSWTVSRSARAGRLTVTAPRTGRHADPAFFGPTSCHGGLRGPLRRRFLSSDSSGARQCLTTGPTRGTFAGPTPIVTSQLVPPMILDLRPQSIPPCPGDCPIP
ncbi:MAG: hypothetical protein IPN03_08340 [Holophagales bacterium]|nr:hypothetical protein [Holophagales bacterium]